MIKKFFEYVDTERKYNYIEFNDNEIKFLSAKGNLFEKYSELYLNYRVIKKLSNGNYFVFKPKIVCTTLQSLLKYTSESTIKVLEELKNRFDNSNITFEDDYKYWNYDNDGIKEWAYQKLNVKTASIQLTPKFDDYIMNKYNLGKFELKLLINTKLNINDES